LRKDITDYQKKWTSVFYESGVNVVIGSHPHVLEPYELIQEEGGQQMLVYYSLASMHRLNPVIAKLWVLYDDETKK